MSPRSDEFLTQARDRLEAAEAALGVGSHGGAVSLAYYATLYAARAALSEEDSYAKTHVGTWQLFHQLFVDSGRFDGKLAQAVRARQQLREAADYDARSVPQEEAELVLAGRAGVRRRGRAHVRGLIRGATRQTAE